MKGDVFEVEESVIVPLHGNAHRRARAIRPPQCLAVDGEQCWLVEFPSKSTAFLTASEMEKADAVTRLGDVARD